MPPDPKNPSAIVALYAHYSSDLQREASIADQLHIRGACSEAPNRDPVVHDVLDVGLSALSKSRSTGMP